MAQRKLRNRISIILPSTDGDHSLLVDRLVASFDGNGISTQIGLSQGLIEREKKYIKDFSSQSDAILLISVAGDYSEIADAIPKNIPVIFLLNEPENCPFTCIIESDYSAVYQGIIASHNRSRTPIACLCENRNFKLQAESIRAYTDAISVVDANIEKDEYIYEMKNYMDMDLRFFLDDLKKKNIKAIYTTTSDLTSSVVYSLMRTSGDPFYDEMVILGYGHYNHFMSNQMHLDLILSPTDEIVSIATSHTLYAISHPESKEKRVLRLKGTLRTHLL